MLARAAPHVLLWTKDAINISPPLNINAIVMIYPLFNTEGPEGIFYTESVISEANF